MGSARYDIPLSVVMPVHNAMPHVDDAVRSILEQTHGDFEFVIFDDGSTDGSTERLREWAERDSRIKLTESNTNLGPVGSSRAVVELASGQIIARMDADDVSHDLTALARTQIAVVSAGAKAILDLPRTLERLETLGVLVVGYGTNEFPAFYSRRSGLMLEHRVDSAEELAAIVREHWTVVGAPSGVLVCNPIPEDAAIDVDDAIARALEDAQLADVVGKRLTPFLLARLADATAGRSITANRALAVNNARVAAELAVAIAADRA